MSYNPGVTFFVPFHDLDPSRQDKCIFFTQKVARCRWSCHRDDNRRAIVLRNEINAVSNEEKVDLELLEEYIRCNCCRSGNARHRDRIEDVNLLTPLAQRWQDEIWARADHSTPVPTLDESVSSPYSERSIATPSPGGPTTVYTLGGDQFHHGSNSPSVYATPSKPAATSPSYFQFGAASPTPTGFGFQPFDSEPRYDLRPRESNSSTRPPPTPPKPLSEFRVHVAEPGPTDSVSGKIRDSLKDRDFETGSVYIFDRASSPGHVKIGWTASSVRNRLKDWSKCGYSPNLLFSVSRVPHAQRVETLTHYELIKEWRRERMCKASRCRKSHQEWFEVSRERAEQVLGYWANFMEKAEPYDSCGRLRDRWKVSIESIEMDGELITGKKLLECYENSLIPQATIIKEEPVKLEQEMKIKKEEDLGDKSTLERLEAFKETISSVGSLKSEAPLLKTETPLLQSTTPPKQTAVVGTCLSTVETKANSDLLLTTTPLPKTEALLETDQLSTKEPSSRTEPLIKAEPQTDNGATHKVTLASVEKEPDARKEPETTNAKESIPSSDAKNIVVDPSPKSTPKLFISRSSSTSHSVTASPLATPSKAIPSEAKAKSSIATEEKLAMEANEQIANATLVKEQTSVALDEAALKIIAEISNKASTRSAKWGLRVQRERKPLDEEAPPAVKVPALA